ncbi:hypothetical protein ABZW30_34395 [Kitasatospora sp. NPDC004669]|uniref:hypothetical protein n=1 Tax=Kitasatospora sp. NPDC004669 TaxID=3154555 RepID=UPI0033A44F01
MEFPDPNNLNNRWTVTFACRTAPGTTTPLQVAFPRNVGTGQYLGLLDRGGQGFPTLFQGPSPIVVLDIANTNPNDFHDRTEP